MARRFPINEKTERMSSRINAKLGAVNVIPDPKSAPIISDPGHPILSWVTRGWAHKRSISACEPKICQAKV